MARLRYSHEIAWGFLRKIIRPGAVLVSSGIRGGGKTHSAISFCQNIIDGTAQGFPEHTFLLTNVIFVRKNKDDGFDTASPSGVYTVLTLKEVFPIIADNIERYGRKDTMFILLLDEAQNFLMGDMNSTDMARSMKSFCGIIRKFNLCLWFISPALRNLGPAFRNFIDADDDPANVTCTLEKNNSMASHFISKHGYDLDPRSLIFVKPGAKVRPEVLLVPKASWTKDPEKLAVGDYAYDHLASADFRIGEGFPFSEFVYAISGKSSFHMIDSIREFYANMEEMTSDTPGIPEESRQAIEKEYREKVVWRMYQQGFTHIQIGDAFGVSERMSQKWIKQIKETKMVGSP